VAKSLEKTDGKKDRTDRAESAVAEKQEKGGEKGVERNPDRGEKGAARNQQGLSSRPPSR